MNYPECEKLNERSNERHYLVNFLQWLEEQGMSFIHTDSDGGSSFIHITHDDLVMDYFQIDKNKLEDERREILAEAVK